MSNEYILYCDESKSRGKYYSNFYGGIILHTRDFECISCHLEQRKKLLNLHGEVKWSKVTENYCEKYINLINEFFDFVAENKIKVRIMFTQNIYYANNLSKYHLEHEYFLLYYQFIKHAFGFRYANFRSNPIKVRIYFDKLPSETKEKVEQFKSYICSLSLNPNFKKAGVLIPKDQIAEVNSHKHVLLQCTDIILGAMQFRLNDKHKEKSISSRYRGKRTIAKEKLYKHIYARIRKIYPNFNIGCTTGRKGEMERVWSHVYRHWCFIPKNKKIDFTKSKSPKAKNPAFAKSV